jgi:hypothetical protein
MDADPVLTPRQSVGDAMGANDRQKGWEDSSARRPGSAASTAAASARAAAPIRSALARFMGLHTDERAWRLRAAREKRVARQLDDLMRATRSGAVFTRLRSVAEARYR